MSKRAAGCIFSIPAFAALLCMIQPGYAEGDVPDFDGIWISAAGPGGGGVQARPGGQGMPGAQRGRGGRMRPQVTAGAQRAIDSYDLLVDDPAYECSPASIWRAWANPTPTAIEQLDDRVILRHEYMDAVRTVYLDGRDHPADLRPGVLGHSIGWYEGNTLVIDTTGFSPSVLLTQNGLPQTGTLHVIERLSLGEDGQTLQLELTSEDPATFKVP